MKPSCNWPNISVDKTLISEIKLAIALYAMPLCQIVCHACFHIHHFFFLHLLYEEDAVEEEGGEPAVEKDVGVGTSDVDDALPAEEPVAAEEAAPAEEPVAAEEAGPAEEPVSAEEAAPAEEVHAEEAEEAADAGKPILESED